MLNIRNIFKKRNSAPAPQTAPSDQGVNWGALNAASPTEIVVGEPETLAQLRLTGGANDVGATRALRMYNNHKTRLQNQWINPLQSVNSGFGTAQLSLYNYQNVNYYECMQLAQDPLFAKVFNMLSRTPFSKGGKLTPPDGDNEYDMDALERAIKQYRIWQEMRDGVRSSYVTGGCLVYMDFGLSESERAQPLDLKRINCHKFRRFKHIDPINITAVDVNTVNPTAPDYMEPTLWYVIGLGVVHKSHFLKFEANPVELPMRPLTLYFGMPLTQLIKQDIANSNLASQGLANLINRSRLTYLKADAMDFATDNNGQFRARMEYVSKWQDNFGVMPLKNTEDILQLTTSLTGYSESVELMYLLVSAKTNIPFTELMGKSAQGENATGEGDRRKWYDQCVSIQEDNKDNLLVMCGVVAGKIGDGHFVEFPDYIFDPLEEVSEKELADNIKAYTDVATALAGLGANPDSLIEWLQTFEQFHLENIKFDTSTPGLDDYDDTDPDGTPGGGLPGDPEAITPQVIQALKTMNADKGDIKDWRTTETGAHFPIKEGQTTKEALESFKSKHRVQPKGKEPTSYQQIIQTGLKDSLNNVLKQVKDNLKYAGGPEWYITVTQGDYKLTRPKRVSDVVNSKSVERLVDRMLERYELPQGLKEYLDNNEDVKYPVNTDAENLFSKETESDRKTVKNTDELEKQLLEYWVEEYNWDDNTTPENRVETDEIQPKEDHPLMSFGGPQDGDTGFNKPDDKGSSGEYPREFGVKYDGFKGKAAIDKLLKEQQGFVPNAFHRNEIGAIHLVWGDDNMGLQHIIKRRKESGQDINRLLNGLTDVIEKGIFSYNTNTGRFEINSNDHVAIISPTFKNKKLQFVLTAYEIRKLNGDS